MAKQSNPLPSRDTQSDTKKADVRGQKPMLRWDKRKWNASSAKRGYIAVNYPSARQEPSARRVTTSDDNQPVDPWVLTVTAGDNTVPTNALSPRGPAYKVVIQVEGVCTWALIDFEAQVTLFRSHMLPRIKEKHGWSIKECHSHGRPLEHQPGGAAGDPLGADLMVVLSI